MQPLMMWHNYHLRVDAVGTDAVCRILVEVVAPTVEALQKRGIITRFFFIRYWDNGPELRLRLRAPREAAVVLQEALEPIVTALRCGPPRLVPYDRAVHYFGPTWDSVYAELLNEQTSALALSLLRQQWPARSVLAMGTAVLLHLLWAESQTTPSATLARIRQARAFALSQASTDVVKARRLPAEQADVVTARAITLRDRLVPQIQTYATVRMIVRLMQRTQTYAPRGEFVVIHALHLLCNKLGFTFGDEIAMYGIAERLAEVSLASEAAVTLEGRPSNGASPTTASSSFQAI